MVIFGWMKPTTVGKGSPGARFVIRLNTPPSSETILQSSSKGDLVVGSSYRVRMIPSVPVVELPENLCPFVDDDLVP
jgi:hypothetical protein